MRIKKSPKRGTQTVDKLYLSSSDEDSKFSTSPSLPCVRGGGFLRSKKTEGLSEKALLKHFLSLRHGKAVTPPSSEGGKLQFSDRLKSPKRGIFIGNDLFFNCLDNGCNGGS